MNAQSVYEIEIDPDYLSWLKEIEDRHPRVKKHGKRPAGASIVGRTLLLAEERDGGLHVGVLLNTKDEFWKPWPGTLDDLVQGNVQTGMFMDKGFYPTREHFPGWVQKHGPVKRLEFCSSHVGGFVAAIMADDQRVMLDEC